MNSFVDCNYTTHIDKIVLTKIKKLAQPSCFSAQCLSLLQL